MALCGRSLLIVARRMLYSIVLLSEFSVACVPCCSAAVFGRHFGAPLPVLSYLILSDFVLSYLILSYCQVWSVCEVGAPYFNREHI